MSRLDELCQLLCEGPLDDQQAAELDALIAAPADEQRFLAIMATHADLQALAAERPRTTALMRTLWHGESRRAISGIRRATRKPKRRSHQPRSASWLAIAASLVAAILIALALVARQPAASDPPIARLLGSQRSFLPGDQFTAASRSRIEKRDDGTLLDLQADGEITFAANDRWILERGDSHWQIAEQHERSFFIETPQARIEIIGTAFRLSVDGRGSEIAMRSGHLHFASRLRDEATDLVAPQRARIDPSGRLLLLDDPPPVTTQTVEPDPPTPAPAAPVVADLPVIPAEPPAPTPLWLAIFDRLQADHPQRVRYLAGELRVEEPTRITVPGAGPTINQAVIASNAFSILLELGPAELPDFDTRIVGSARILTLSDNQFLRNLTIGQGEMEHGWDCLSIRLRTHHGMRGDNGLPAIVVPGVFDNGPVRLLISYDSGSGLRVWRDGRLLAEEAVDGDLGVWDPDFPLALAGENGVSEDGLRSWLGSYRRIAIYDRAITPAELPTD